MTKLLPAMAGETCSPAPIAAGRGCIDPLSRSERRPQSLHGSAGRAGPRCSAGTARDAAGPLRRAPRPPRAGATQSCARCRPQLSQLLPGKLRRWRRGSSSPRPALRGAARPRPGRGGRWPRGAPRRRGAVRSGAARRPPPLRGAARQGAERRPPRRGLGAGRLPQVSVRRRRRAPPARSCALAPSPAAWAESY